MIKKKYYYFTNSNYELYIRLQYVYSTGDHISAKITGINKNEEKVDLVDQCDNNSTSVINDFSNTCNCDSGHTEDLQQFSIEYEKPKYYLEAYEDEEDPKQRDKEIVVIWIEYDNYNDWNQKINGKLLEGCPNGIEYIETRDTKILYNVSIKKTTFTEVRLFQKGVTYINENNVGEGYDGISYYGSALLKGMFLNANVNRFVPVTPTFPIGDNDGPELCRTAFNNTSMIGLNDYLNWFDVYHTPGIENNKGYYVLNYRYWIKLILHNSWNVAIRQKQSGEIYKGLLIVPSALQSLEVTIGKNQPTYVNYGYRISEELDSNNYQAVTTQRLLISEDKLNEFFIEKIGASFIPEGFYWTSDKYVKEDGSTNSYYLGVIDLRSNTILNKSIAYWYNNVNTGDLVQLQPYEGSTTDTTPRLLRLFDACYRFPEIPQNQWWLSNTFKIKSNIAFDHESDICDKTYVRFSQNYNHIIKYYKDNQEDTELRVCLNESQLYITVVFPTSQASKNRCVDIWQGSEAGDRQDDAHYLKDITSAYEVIYIHDLINNGFDFDEGTITYIDIWKPKSSI